MPKETKRSYSLDPVVMKLRRAKKVVRDLEKLRNEGIRIVKEVVDLGLLRWEKQRKN